MASGGPQDQIAYPPRLLRVQSAARYLGLGVRTFLRLVAEGKLPRPRRIGGGVAWDRYKLDAFVDDSDEDVVDNTVDRLLKEADD